MYVVWRYKKEYWEKETSEGSVPIQKWTSAFQTDENKFLLEPRGFQG